MYKAVRKFQLDIPPQLLLDVVYDVGSYPEFVKGVRRVELLEDDGRRARARFSAGLAGMTFDYVLEVQRREDAVEWKRLSGSFRDAEGAMVHLGDDRFRYENALDPGFAVPEFAVRFVLERSLPRLLNEFQTRAKALRRAGKVRAPSAGGADARGGA